MLASGRLEAWRARLKQAPPTQPSTARRWIPVSAAGGGGKRSKPKRGEAGGRGAADASSTPLPPGAPPPPPTVAPPEPKKSAPLQRSSYRRPRRTTEEVRAEREARERANAEAAQGLTRYLGPEALAAAAAAAAGGGGGGAPGAEGIRVGGGPITVQAPGRLIIVDGYNYLNASPRYAPLVKSGRLDAARNAFHAALETYTAPSRPNAAAAASAPSVIVVYDAMSAAAPRQGGGPAAAAADRAVRDAMERVSARFPVHSMPSAHRLREMALQELGIATRASGSGWDEATEVAPNVTAVFSRSCEADTWILDEIDSVAARWRQGSGDFGSGGSGGGRRPPGDVVVVSNDRRVQEGVLYAAMELIGQGPEGSGGRSSSSSSSSSRGGGSGGSGASSGSGGAGLSLAAWACSRFDGELSGGSSAAAGPGSDARRAVGGGGAAAAAAAAAWARGGAGAYGFTSGGGLASGAESDTEGDWPDGDYDESGSASDVDGPVQQRSASDDRASEAAAPLTPDAVSELLSVSGDALAAADASLEALLGFDIGLGGGGGLLDPGGGGGGSSRGGGR